MFEALAWINDPRPATSSGSARADSVAKASLIDVPPPTDAKASAGPISVEDDSSQDAVALAPGTEAETLESTEGPTMQRAQRRPKKSTIHTRQRKADFHTYGRENVEPVNGGIVYGDYLVSHNVRAHRSDVREVFPGALRRIGIAMPPTRLRGLRGRTKSSKRRAKSEHHVKTPGTPAPAVESLAPTAAVQFKTTSTPKPAEVPAGIRYLRSTKVADCLVW